MNLTCRACDSPLVRHVGSFNEYPSTGFGLSQLVPFSAYNCTYCGLDFLTTDSPHFVWRLQSSSSLRLNEPTSHLDTACAYLYSIISSIANPIFFGFSYKDDTLLQKLHLRGFRVNHRDWDLLPDKLDGPSQLNWAHSLFNDLSFHNASSTSILILTKALEHIFQPTLFSQLFRVLPLLITSILKFLVFLSILC